MVDRDLTTMMAEALTGRDVADRRLDDGRLAHLESDPRPDVRFRIRVTRGDSEHSYPLIAFAPLGSRPSDYPEDLPFIGDLPVVVGVDPGMRMLAWAAPGDRDRLVALLREQCAQDEWEEASSTSHWLGVDRYELRRKGQRRLIISASLPPLVELLEMPWPASDTIEEERES